MFDPTAAAAVLKTTFTPKRINSMTPESGQYPLWKLLSKKQKDAVKGAFGLKFIIPIKTNTSQAVSTSATDAETTAAAASTTAGSAAEYKAFEVQARVYYGAYAVDGVTSLTADGRDQGSFVDALAESAKDIMESMMVRYAIYAHGAGYAEMGKVKTGSSVSATQFTIRRGDRRKIRKGMKLFFSATQTGTLRTNTPALVTKVTSTGLTTVSGVDISAAGVAADDFIFAADARSTSANTPTVITGLAAYNPVTEPSTTTILHGLDISTDWRLSGMRVAYADYGNILEAIYALAMELADEGSPPTHALANTEVWNQVVDLLPDQSVYKSGVGEGSVGFDTVKVRTPAGTVELVNDTTCVDGEIRMFSSEHLFWAYAGPSVIHPMNQDGLEVRKLTGDTWGGGLRSVVALCCDKPNSLGILTGIPVS
jgi:hypothetical protein